MALFSALPPWASALPDLIADAFPHSRPDTRRALAAAAVVRTFDPGDAILRQGDDSALALILDGHVAVRRTTVDGREMTMAIVTRGGLTSMLSLVTRPAGADAVALSPTPAALWRGGDVRSLATTDPGLALDILDHALGRLDEVVGRLDGLIHQDALRRVARVLDERADLFFAEDPVLTRAHLPALVGTSREMTGRVLRILEGQGIVARVGRSSLRLLDPAGLAAAAQSELRVPTQTRPTKSFSVLAGGHDAVRVVRRDAERRHPKTRSASGWSLSAVPSGRRE